MDRIGNSYLSSVATAENTKEIVIQAVGSPAVTASGNTAGVDVSSYREGLLFIDITAVSGTSPSCTFTLKTYDFNSGKWVAVPNVSIAAQTGVNTLAVAVTNFGEQIRLDYALSGTSPSFTFSASFVAKS